ncbi:ABC transporter permease [Flavitalea sp. BT771]|uniref:ABC transporter permease n=1 Tax=Flavitalea sp. BT771 TaxID=3063329 RepID=UPI0026E15149|nr:ABC transporter permease [Flavitalea sp. BT771]MDO6429955.1 ABC transporter permease [Flavitalea sp. BT771]MDV6217917.1 ABC transporter permease [Flavitalea sp. BT771]
MVRNFLRIAFRNLSHRRGYSLLNILGLTAGITCCLLIFEYVAFERSYDTFHEKVDRIFRVQDVEYENGKLVVPCAAAMPAVAPTMKRDFPEVENACRIYKTDFLLTNDVRNIKLREPAVYFADAAILDMFHLPLQEGDPGTALTGLGKIILSEGEARKYFGKEDPLGKVLNSHYGGRIRPLEVTGVFRDFPANSHLKLSVIISYPTLSQYRGTYGKTDDPVETSWSWPYFYTYVLLRKGTDPQRLAAKLPAFIDKYYNDLPENKSHNDRFSLSLMPLRDIHLYSHYAQEAEQNGDGQSVSYLLLIAFFIIGIAWINFVNLATARSLERAREVGVRKVLGAMRRELIRQFLLESLLLNLMALATALVVTLALNPFFGRFIGRPLDLLFSLPAVYWGSFAALFLTGTFLSGIYPALVLSRYLPVNVLKGSFRNAAGGKWLRKSLIVGQFAASIILIAGTMIVYKQVNYMRSQKLGADIDQTLVVKGASAGLTDSAYQDFFQSFKGEVLQVKGVRSITASSNVMGQEILWSTDWNRMSGADRHVFTLFMVGVDDDFIRSYGLKLVAGRNFSRSFVSDRRSVVLNESAARELGFPSPQAAIGQLVEGGQVDMDSLYIIGVIADYHSESLQKAIQPLVLLPYRDRRGYYSIKVQAAEPAATIKAIKNIWDRHFPDDPYTYFFLDEFFSRQYTENQHFGAVFALFALLAIAIACFGLLGLSAYNVLQRTKEIGIRKALGASAHSLLFLLTKDFLILVVIAMVISIPVTWMAMERWLQGFAYRIGIGWWVFGLSGLLAVVIAFVTVGGQSLKAAMKNPVDSLRTE